MNKLTIPAGEKEQLKGYQHFGSFDKGVAALKKKGLELITSEDLAEHRIAAKGHEEYHQRNTGTWTAENYNYGLKGEILIASRKFNPILKNPTKATDAHRSGNEFYLDAITWKALRERAETDPEKAIKSGVLLLPRKDYRRNLPTNAFEEYAPTRFHFRQQATPYGRFLKARGITSIGHYVVEEYDARKQPKPFGQALWVDYLHCGSNLEGHDRYRLSDSCDGWLGVLGVRRAPTAVNEPKTKTG